MLSFYMGPHGTSSGTVSVTVKTGNLDKLVQMFAFHVVLHICYKLCLKTTFKTAEGVVKLPALGHHDFIQVLEKVRLLLTLNKQIMNTGSQVKHLLIKHITHPLAKHNDY